MTIIKVATKSIFAFFAFILFTTDISAQSVGINFSGAAPNSSAALDIDVTALGTKKGLLIPRVTLANRTAMNPLAIAAQGLLVYQTDGVEGFYYNTSLTTTPNWIYLSPSGSNGRWDQITAPAGNLSLAHGANTTSFTFNGLTNAAAFALSSNSLVLGDLIDLTVTSTAAPASSNVGVLVIGKSGANINSGVSSSGIYSSITNTGTNSTNMGGYFSASGATSNYGVKTSATGSGTNNFGGWFTAFGGLGNQAVHGETNSDGGIGIYGLNNNSTGSFTEIGIYGQKNGATGSGTGYGVGGTATGTGTYNYGGNFYASGATNNYGAQGSTDADGGIGLYGVNSSTGFNFTQIGVSGQKTGGNAGGSIGYGVYGSATGPGVQNFGGNFYASGASVNYGAKGSSDASSGVGLYGVNNSTTTGIAYGVIGEKAGSTAAGTGYGIYGIASGTGNYNYGGFFTVSGATFTNQAVHGETSTNNGIGIYGLNSSTGSGTQIGVSGVKSNSTPSGIGYGVSGSASGTANQNMGGNFTAAGALFNYGVMGVATSANANYGGYFSASGGTNNYALIVPSGGGSVGIGTATPFTDLHVRGTVNVFYNGTSTHTGNFWAGNSNVDGVEIVSTAGGDAYISVQRTGGPGMNISRTAGPGTLVSFNIGGSNVGTVSTDGSTTFYNSTSDMRLKENINPTKSGLATILKMNVKDYNFKTDAKKQMQTGFLAQELYAIFPQAVHVGGDDAKTNPWTVDYSKLTPVLVKGIQEQQQQINDLQTQNQQLVKEAAEANKKIDALIERLNKLEQSTQKTPATTNTLQ
jgi:hypothetical protein